MRELISNRFLVIIFCFLLSGCIADKNGDDLIYSRAFYEDSTSISKYEEIKNLEFTPYVKMLNAGYKSSSIWVKIKINKSDKELVLSVKPPYIDDIDVYYEDRKIYSVIDGSYVPGGQNPFGVLPYAFPLPPSDEERVVYLRFKSMHSYQIIVEALPAKAFFTKDTQEQVIYASYITLALILVILLFGSWLMDKSLVVAVFAIQQVLGFLHSFALSGFAQFFLDKVLSPYFVNNFSFLLIVTYPLVGFYANKLLLSEFGALRTYRFGLNALIAGSLIVIVLALLGDTTALKWNALLILLAMTFFWVVAIWGLKPSNEKTKPESFIVRALRIYYSANLVLWIAAVLPLLGQWNIGTLAFQLLLAYNTLSGLMLFFILQYRSKYRFEVEVARTSALENQANAERRQREELSMMMAMLSHELKTPLSILKLILDEKVAGTDLQGHADRAMNNMAFVVNRCLQFGKLEADKIESRPEVFNVDVVLTSVLKNFAVNGPQRVLVKGDPKLSVEMDLNVFSIVMSNLIDNALKYSPQESQIEIKYTQFRRDEKNSLIITVKNSVGMMGVPDPSQVFKKYYRNNAATKIAGSGLGLFLISELIKILNGTAQYENQGTEVIFTLWIPT